ncbi:MULTISPECIES: permease-like cell division protein FtsX [Streptosporangium]|uniref:FtsX extracellular domain-containing protein n=1 Tax=Streptosporangium brasiliense TaxID=47480 RepID=A0ABT9R3T1_9ACTN|nr:permease-like cell division protein FtsX [Streptosporangium brasiliense]MDP9863879.1 hypothetical protein [Streptosporangium brasiliense]
MTVTENRLREALSAAAATAVDVRPLTAPARRRSRAPFRTAAAALAVAVIAFGAVRLSAPSPAPDGEIAAMAMSAVEPSGAPEVSVFLCKDGDPLPNCAGRGITETEREDLRRTLEGRPEVESVLFEDRQRAWEKFRRQYEDDPQMLAAIVPADMPESFRARIRPEAGSRAVARAASGLPGVSVVVDSACLLRKASLVSLARRILLGADDEERCSFTDKGR